MSLPVLKVTVNESFFIPCQNGFSSTLANLYTDFMRAQRTPNANFSIIDIMETFNNNQEEFQMFLAQVGTLLAQKSSNPLKFSNNVAGYVQYNKETQTLQKKYDALSEKIEHEEKKLYDIRMGGITGWISAWRYKKTLAKIENLNEKSDILLGKIDEHKTHECLYAHKSVNDTFSKWNNEYEKDKKFLKFANFLCAATKQGYSNYNQTILNSPNLASIPETKKHKALLLQSCVCAQIIAKIAEQNCTNNAKQFNKSAKYFNSQKASLANNEDLVHVEKVSSKVECNNSKKAGFSIILGSVVNWAMKKMQSTTLNHSKYLTRDQNPVNQFTENAAQLEGYLNLEKQKIKHTNALLDIETQNS